MALQDRLFQQLRVSLPGAVDEVITEELWEVLNDICRDGLVWRETLDVTLVAGDIDYSVGVDGAEIVKVFSVHHETMDINNVIYEFGTVVFVEGVPTATDALTPMKLVVALVPALTPGVDVEAWIPSDLWTLLHQALLAGVKARMMAHPAKPYSNPQMAVFHLREYRGLKAVEKRRAEVGNRQGAQTWVFPPFAVRSVR
jgi:hypothetical protein